MKKIIKTCDAPSAIGPYNQGTICGNLIFTAGQIPLDEKTMEIVGDNVSAQTEKVLQNLLAVVKAGGGDASTIIKTTVFLKDMNDFAAMNEVYAKYLGENAPARSAVQVVRLPKDVLVEIECVAEVL